MSTYLRTTADREDVTSAADYYAKICDQSSNLGATAIIERGRQAGRDLSGQSAAAIDDL